MWMTQQFNSRGHSSLLSGCGKGLFLLTAQRHFKSLRLSHTSCLISVTLPPLGPLGSFWRSYLPAATSSLSGHLHNTVIVSSGTCPLLSTLHTLEPLPCPIQTFSGLTPLDILFFFFFTYTDTCSLKTYLFCCIYWVVLGSCNVSSKRYFLRLDSSK